MIPLVETASAGAAHDGAARRRTRTVYDRIQELGCIIVGEDRKHGIMMEGRFQVSEAQVQYYRQYLES
jgi:hypothetical protein